MGKDMEIKIAGAEIEEPFLRQLVAQKHLGRCHIFIELRGRKIESDEIAVKDKRREEDQKGEFPMAMSIASFSRHAFSLVVINAADVNVAPVAKGFVL